MPHDRLDYLTTFRQSCYLRVRPLTRYLILNNTILAHAFSVSRAEGFAGSAIYEREHLALLRAALHKTSLVTRPQRLAPAYKTSCHVISSGPVFWARGSSSSTDLGPRQPRVIAGLLGKQTAYTLT